MALGKTCLALLATCLAASALAGGLREVAHVDTNGLEGLAQAADGSWRITDATAKRIWRLDGDGSMSAFAQLDVVPQAIEAVPGGWAVTAQEREPDFRAMAKAGPTCKAFSRLGALLLVLDDKGQVTRHIKGPAGAFFNGVDRLGDGLLVADSCAATIWRIDLRTGVVRAWLRSALLAGAGGRFPGANGLRIADGHVYVANSTTNAILRVAVGDDGRARGAPERVASVDGPDDFAIASGGTILLPSTDRLVSVPPGSGPSVLGAGCTGCDSARLARDGRTLLLVTHGFGANPGPGKVFAYDIGSQPAMENPLGLKPHHVTARVRDLARSVAWYTEVLGLAVAAQGERGNGAMKFAELRVGDYSIALVQLDSPATEVQPGQALLPTWIHPVFSVADPDALYRAFKARGVPVAVHGPEPPKVESFLLHDPDGNELEIVAASSR